MADITYCINSSCPFKDCDKHLCHNKKKKGLISVAALDGVCRRYIAYLVDLVEEKKNDG